jgi:DNA invertase Pin-like site-specific DNA recombinase
MIAKNPEWEFAGLYADEGISGTRADKRPQFKQMIKDCLAGKIDIIITKSVSRFARNTVECLEYVRMLKARGIGIYFEEQNIDTLKSDSELYLVIYAGFAQSESESMSKNITWSFRKNFEEGKVIFRYSQLLGYRKGADGEPEIVPEEAAVVERIFDMFLAGMPMRDISLILQSENITFPNKEFKFTKRMVQNILRNEKYCGDCILQKTVTVSCITKERKINEGEAPMYLVENNHPAIISREKFNRTQEELSRRNALAPKSTKRSLTATGKYSKYALTEVMICGECGSRYKRVTWSRNGKKKIVWRCISRLDYGIKYCTDSLTVEEGALKRAIVRALKRFNAEDRATYLTLMKATIGDAIGLNGCSDEIDFLERRIDALNKRMINLVNESVQNGEDMEIHEDDFKEISGQISQLQRRIEVIRESEARDDSYANRVKSIQNTIDQRDANADVYDDTIVRQMIECIKVYKDKRILIIFGGGYEIEENLE